MFVCICNALTDGSFMEALKSSHDVASAEDVYVRASGGLTPRCGRCLETVREMLETVNDMTAEAAE